MPGTLVLLADGTYKPIEQVKLGDRVLATDPTTGTTQSRPVLALIPGSGLKELIRVTVDTDGDRGNATGTVTATDEHPFWVTNTGRWTDAEDLHRGNMLRTPDGHLLKVVAVHEWTQQQQVHNLTVEGLHTYYVNVGGQDVLTHNAGSENCSTPAPGDRSTTREEWQEDQSRQRAEQSVANVDQPLEKGGDEPTGTGGKSGTKTDRLKEHLTEKDLDAARRELNGEVVARKADGTPWDHVDEVQNAQRGLVNRINQLNRQLGDSRLSDADRAAAQSELSEASRLLDHSEGFVPRG